MYLAPCRVLRHAPIRSFIDALEPRRLFSPLVVEGTAGPDAIEFRVVGGIINITVNSVPSSELDSLVTAVIINCGDGDDEVHVENNTNNTLTINGGADDDAAIFAPASRMWQTLPAPMSFNGGAGIDRFQIFDESDASGDSFSIGATSMTAQNLSKGAVSYFGVESAQLLSGGSADTFNVLSLDPATAVLLAGGGGNDQFNVQATAPAGGLLLDGQAGLDNVMLDVGATARMVGAQDLNSIELRDAAKLALSNSNDTTSARVLTLAANNTLDVGAGSLVLDYTGTSPLPDLVARLRTGYANGDWNGPGLNSSAVAARPGTALGYAEAADLPGGVAAGPLPDASSLVVRWTLYGDANLDRAVNISDFSTLGSNFNSAPRAWSKGNFNYDNGVDIGDFSLLASNFNRILNGTVIVSRHAGSRLSELFGSAPIALA